MTAAVHVATEERARHAISSPAEKIEKMARRAMDQADGDIRRATDIMESKVRADSGLFKALMGPLVREACYDRLRKCVHQDRREVWTAPNYTKAGNGERLESAALTLMDFRLPHNLLPLREARKDDLESGAQWYESRAEGMQHKARWLRLVAARIGEAAVGDALTAEALAQIQGEAK